MIEVPRHLEKRCTKVVSFSALLTGRLYPQGYNPGTPLC